MTGSCARLAGFVSTLLALAGCGGATKPDAGSARPAPVSEPPAALLRCGEQEVAAGFSGESMRLHVGDETFDLRAVRSASGAKYEAAGDPTTSFWSKGENALLVVRGRSYPECVPAARAAKAFRARGNEPAALLQGAEWLVESLDGAAVLEDSRVTLVFGEDGRVSGDASCNGFTGEYSLTGEGLSIGKLATTKKACPPPLMRQEDAFLEGLGQAQRFEITPEGKLSLQAADGRRVTAKR